MEDDFSVKGFLSPDIDRYRETVKRVYASEFSHTVALSDQAQKLLMELPVGEEVAAVLAAVVFFERSIRCCQAALLLCESGLVQEAQILVRTATETLFAGAALVTDQEVFHRFARSADHEDSVQARGMLKTLGETLTLEQMSLLHSVIDRARPDAGKYAMYEAAQTAGLGAMYETFYRGLSAKASHATFRSLDKSFVKDGEQYCLVMGPSDDDLSFTLRTIRTCLSETIRFQTNIHEYAAQESK
jgi:hypothetical protein